MSAALVPYFVIKNLWWLLPVLSAILGAILGRKLPSIHTLAVRGTSVCLLLAVAFAVAVGVNLTYVGMSFGISYSIVRVVVLLLEALVAGSAVACAFSPTRMGCGAAALGAVLWLANATASLTGRLVFVDKTPAIMFWWVVAIGVLAAVLAFMGFFGTEKAPAVKPAEPQETPPAPQETTATMGSLTILTGNFAGQKLPLGAGEELTLGSDASHCHLILDQLEIPPRLCSIRWLEERNTYLISSHAPEGLLWGTGGRAPSGSTIEVFPQTICYLPATGQPVFQVG